jgi:hypothetical protein
LNHLSLLTLLLVKPTLFYRYFIDNNRSPWFSVAELARFLHCNMHTDKMRSKGGICTVREDCPHFLSAKQQFNAAKTGNGAHLLIESTDSYQGWALFIFNSK